MASSGQSKASRPATSKAAIRKRRRYGGRSHAERQADRRARLIEAAIRVYGESGYRRANVKAVCAAAGLTERYFYETFRNSEELLGACFEHVTRRLIEHVRGAGVAARGRGAARAKAMLLAYYEALRREPRYARVFLVEMAGISPSLDRLFFGSLDSFAELLVEMLDPERRGPLARDPLIARGVTGGILQIALAWIGDDYARPIEDVVGAAAKLCAIAQPKARGGGERR